MSRRGFALQCYLTRLSGFCACIVTTQFTTIWRRGRPRDVYPTASGRRIRASSSCTSYPSHRTPWLSCSLCLRARRMRRILEHYFTANEGDKQRAILLNAVGASTYRLIRTLVSPAKVTDISFADIVEKARAHFNPKPSPIVKRYDEAAGRNGVNSHLRSRASETCRALRLRTRTERYAARSSRLRIAEAVHPASSTAGAL